MGTLDRTSTHNVHLCSTVCSQARNAHHALGSRASTAQVITDCISTLCAPEKNLSSGVAHVSPFVVLSPAVYHEHIIIFLIHSSFYHDTRTRRTPSTSRTSPSSPSRQAAPSRITLACRVAETRAPQLPQVRANSERKRGLLSNASNDAPQNDVGRGSSEGTHCGNRRLQRGLLAVTSEPRRNREQSVDRAASRGRAGTRLHLGSRVSIPRSQGSSESVGHVLCERSHEFHGDGTITTRRLLVLSF